MIAPRAIAAAMVLSTGCVAPTPVAKVAPTAPRPPEPDRREPARPQSKAPAVQPCDSEMFGGEPGKHDRYSFEADDGKFGFKNQAGEVVIPPRFLFAYEFTEAQVTGAVDEDGFLFLDTSGRELARAFAFDNGPDYFVGGMARIVHENKVGFIAKDGTIAIAPRFDFAGSFCRGRAVVCTDCRERPIGEHRVIEGGKWGYIDRSGNLVVPFRYDAAEMFNEDGTATVIDRGRELTIDLAGTELHLGRN